MAIRGDPGLSKEVTWALREGYEQRITRSDGSLHLLLKASLDLTFSDGHHELETVNLAVYPPVGDKPDQISANRAIYDQANSMMTFLGNVKIETKDALKVDTESIVYNQATEVGQTDAPIAFTRENLSGNATGAMLDGKSKRLELKKDVQITVAPEASKDSQAKPQSARSRPVSIRSTSAVFEQASMKLSFFGGVAADQERDTMSGTEMFATLNEQKRLQKIEVRGNAYLSSREDGRAAEVQSADMDFFLDKDQRLERAVAMKDARSRTLDADADMTLTGASLIEVKYQAQGDRSLLREMRTEGRSVITLAAPKSKAGDPRSANKRLTADAVKLTWRATGRDLEKAEAVGNSELFVDPVAERCSRPQDTTGSRFDCDFFEAGNLARVFTATGGAKAVIEPVIKTDARGTRTLSGRKIATVFVKETQDVERMDAQEDAKFNENDRNGIAANISYVAADDMVRLRGGEPTVWDSRARTKGVELDSNLRDEVSYSRGKTATTYYSQEQTNGATPFTKVKSPVYVVSDRGEFHHESGVAIYTGNARAWQDDNFVRGDKLTMYMNEKKMDAMDVAQRIYKRRRKTTRFPWSRFLRQRTR